MQQPVAQLLVVSVLLLVQLQSVASCCPNQCSGHGICTALGNGCVCSCFKGYSGGDCSRRTLHLLFGYFALWRVTGSRLVVVSDLKAAVRWGQRGATLQWQRIEPTCRPCARIGAPATPTLASARATLGSLVSSAIACRVQTAALTTATAARRSSTRSAKTATSARSRATTLTGTATWSTAASATTATRAGTAPSAQREDAEQPENLGRRQDPGLHVRRRLRRLRLLAAVVSARRRPAHHRPVARGADHCLHTHAGHELRAEFPWRTHAAAGVRHLGAEPLQNALSAVKTVGLARVTYSSGTAACTLAGSNKITIEFISALGDIPPLRVDLGGNAALLPDFIIDCDGTGTSKRGTVENAECSNNGVCNYGNGRCSCFDDMISSNGLSAVGLREDCGYVMPVEDPLAKNLLLQG